MAVDEGTVVKRAKALAEQDGFAWELTMDPPKPGKVEGKRLLDDARRQEYLARARAELEKRAGKTYPPST